MSRLFCEIDVSTREILTYPIPEHYKKLGGRGITSRYIAEKVPPKCHPLDKHNLLILCPGILGGTGFICGGKLSIGAKSPLTQGIKEANAGGRAAHKLARLGYAAIIIKNLPLDPKTLSLLVIDEKGIRFDDGSNYKMVPNYPLNEKLRNIYHPKSAILSIGPAGEQGLLAASIASSDMDEHPSRHAARGGLGAVMGSKGIKAIIIDDSRIKESLCKSIDRKTVVEISRSLTKEITPKKAGLTKYGTSGGISTNNALGGMVTQNFRKGSWDKVENFNGEKLFENIEKRGGKPSTACLPGCPFKCSNYYIGENGEYITSSLEFETTILFGPNCLIDDLDTIAKMDYACDNMGLDGIDTGVLLGMACEHTDLMEFGDGKRAIELINEVGKGSLLGKIIGSGAMMFGKTFGINRVPVAKNQGLPAWDARALKGMGTTYATSPMGGDHTAGPATVGRVGLLDKSVEVEVSNPKHQNIVSKTLQSLIAICDTMGICFFVGPDEPLLERYAKSIAAHLGIDYTVEEMLKDAKETIQKEIEYNDRSGVPRIDYPFFLREEPISPQNHVFDVSDEELEEVFKD